MFKEVLDKSFLKECAVWHVREVARLLASLDYCFCCSWLACLSRGPSVCRWTLAAAGAAAAAKVGLLGYQQTTVACDLGAARQHLYLQPVCLGTNEPWQVTEKLSQQC